MEKDLIISSLSTCIAEIVTLPINTIKTNYQNLQQSIPKIITNIYKFRGIYGFYNSSLWAGSSQIISSTMKYTLYEKFKHNYSNLLAALLAGLITCSVTHPIDVFKIHYQMNNFNVTRNILYRGFSKSLAKSAVGTTIIYPVYDYFRSYNVLLASLIAAISATIVTQPIDFVKSRQVYGLDIYVGYNILHYYRGLSLNLLRVVPNFTISMILIERFKDIAR